jgi:hypothetical protein
MKAEVVETIKREEEQEEANVKKFLFTEYFLRTYELFVHLRVFRNSMSKVE